ncbi:NADPH-dependent ferric siderophore reductase [Amaricoccus macauensis]|uniref:NADPH-dependent ferric siderophore reductase n=1 Tax=Amaricoccus macauensis TaxID=57001 RepID=A0A840SLR0_9RHOB|nr:siderophore-interacting protein [Amaricoccus macauensis]MBB5220301.1 NADPH-dependent ferric siderophore reductase [Amaricoccus macauensis]
MQHQVLRVRHELKRRTLTVQSVAPVTPGMIRIVLADPSLADFVSAGFDDHVKLFFPNGADDGGGGEPAMRDYTPRAFDPEACTLTLDFVLHDGGPATGWAVAARPGDELRIGGPRGSVVVSDSFDWWILVGDETALPAIGRRLEEAPRGARITTIVAVTGPEEEQEIATRADHRAIWVHRPATDATDPAPLLAALAGLDWPEGEGFVWIAAEAGIARALRSHLLDVRQHPRQWHRASGYWLEGSADAHVSLDD